VAVKNPTPPEIRGVSCAIPHRAAQNVAKAKAANLADLAILEREKPNIGLNIAITVAISVARCVSELSAICRLIVTCSVDEVDGPRDSQKNG
jgi:hypothetical protein